MDASHGVALLSPSVTRRLLETFTRPVHADRLSRLTERETDVLSHVARGLSNAQIAEALRLGESTVKSHVSSRLTKLTLTSRTQTVVLAYETGLVTPGRPGTQGGTP